MARPLATRSTVAYFALALAPLALGACDDSPTDEDSGGTTLSVYLKDAPGDVDKVWLQIDDVVLAGDEAPRSLLTEPTGLIEVSALIDSATALARNHEIDAGTYREVRLVLGGAVLQTAQNVYAFGDVELPEGLVSTGTLQCPSCSQSGIKVKLAEALTLEEGENGFLLDVDLTQSFGHQAGQSGKWVMHPVVHGSVADPGAIEDGTAFGRITGTVALANDDGGVPIEVPTCGGEARTLADFVPAATAATLTDDEGEPLLFTGTTASNGEDFTFAIGVGGADDYTLGYATQTVFDSEQLEWTATVAPEGVTLAEQGDEATGVAFTVTAATCTEVTPP
jgi:hypothetical protein